MKTQKSFTPGQLPAKEQFTGTPPFIFSIPRPYEDGNLARDKDMYVKVQQLHKRFLDLKQQLLAYAAKHETQYQQTRQAIDRSRYIIKKYIQRKQKDDDELYG